MGSEVVEQTGQHAGGHFKIRLLRFQQKVRGVGRTPGVGRVTGLPAAQAPVGELERFQFTNRRLHGGVGVLVAGPRGRSRFQRFQKISHVQLGKRFRNRLLQTAVRVAEQTLHGVGKRDQRRAAHQNLRAHRRGHEIAG